MKIILTIIIVSLLILKTYPQEIVPGNIHTVLTKRMIQASGMKRLSDIFSLINNWHFISIDGFRWKANPLGKSSYDNSQWILMLNGNKVILDLFDMKNINLLPVVLQDIDSVEFGSSNQIYNGEFIETGFINIHTKKRENISFSAGYSSGNKIDDPGPFLYTDLASPNVEELGPDYYLSTGMAYKRIHFSGALNIYAHSSTDDEIFKRSLIHFDNLQVYTFSPNIMIDINHKTSNHNLFFGLTTTYFLPFSEDRGSDLFFLRPYGKEIPVKSTFFNSNASGNFNIRRNNVINYRTGYSFSKHEKPYNEFPFNFGWNFSDLFGNADLSFQSGIFNNTTGIGFEHFILSSPYFSSPDPVTFYKVYNKLSLILMNQTEQSLSVYITGNNSNSALKTTISNLWNINKNHLLSTSLSFIEDIPQDNKNYWQWIERGYNIFDGFDFNYVINGKLRKTTRYNASIALNAVLSENIFSEVSFSVNNLNNIAIEREIYDFDPLDFSFASPAVLFTDIKGNIFNSFIKINHKVGLLLEQQMSYLFTNGYSVNKIFREEWDKIPRHKFSYIITYFPAENFVIWGKLQYLSSAYWYEYQNVNEQSSGFYKSEINSNIIFDASFQKWIWEKRIRLGIIFNNMFNEENRLHPLGINFGLSMHVQIAVQIN